MKRDMDLVRTLLRVVEAADQGKAYENHQLDVFSREVQYHLRLIVDAGLARCVGASSDGDVCIRLTWKGHELLELTRSDEIWNRAKHVVRDATGGTPFEAITSLLRRWALEAVGEDRPLRVVDQERAAAPQGGFLAREDRAPELIGRSEMVFGFVQSLSCVAPMRSISL